MIEYEVIDKLNGYANMEDRVYIKFTKYPEEWKKPMRLLSCLESRRSMRVRAVYDVNEHGLKEYISSDRVSEMETDEIPERTVEQIALYCKHKDLLETRFPYHNNNAIALYMPSELEDSVEAEASCPRYSFVSGNYKPDCKITKDMIHNIINDKIKAWSFLCYHNDKLS